MVLVLAIYLVGAAGGLVFALLLGLRAYENRRYFRSRLRNPIPTEVLPLVELIVPCKGIDLDFDAMILDVLTQDYPEYRVTFVVEGPGDPAHDRLAELLPRYPQARLLAAGPAVDCGQKVHNLLAATDRLDPAVEVLAFMDSDIRPAADWLRRNPIDSRRSEGGLPDRAPCRAGDRRCDPGRSGPRPQASDESRGVGSPWLGMGAQG